MSMNFQGNDQTEALEKLKAELDSADAVVVGAGAGMSTSAGFTYSGERFKKYFSDFEEAYDFHDMYFGGFEVMDLPPEVMWAFWSRNIYINRYMDPPKPVYNRLMDLIKDKDYFVITTNVDHSFQKAGIDKNRLFYTQGDYGLFQSTDPEIKKTYDNEEWVREAVEAQGFVIADDGTLTIPEGGKISMKVPHEMFPRCPDNGGSMRLNLRADEDFVEDEGWHEAAERYNAFIDAHSTGHVLYFELGVGNNTPVIIKYPFWRMTNTNPDAVYACVNFDNAFCPEQIRERSIMIKGDIGEVLETL